MKPKFSPLILITIPIFAMFMDMGSGMDDYFILSFAVSFALGYVFLAYKLQTNCKYVLKKHMPKALLILVSISIVLISVAYWGYLIEPYEIKIVARGNSIRYKYHYWTFGMFFLTHGVFCLYLLFFSIYKIFTGKVK
jgi:hypothetical protein